MTKEQKIIIEPLCLECCIEIQGGDTIIIIDETEPKKVIHKSCDSDKYRQTSTDERLFQK